MKISALLRRLTLGMVLAFGLSNLYAQSYPSQSLKLVMPFAPGTAAENALRLFADKLAVALKQSVVLENKPGAGSTLGTDQVAKGPADGYTLLATFNSSIAPGPLMYNKMDTILSRTSTIWLCSGSIPNTSSFEQIIQQNPFKSFWPLQKTSQAPSITHRQVWAHRAIWLQSC